MQKLSLEIRSLFGRFGQMGGERRAKSLDAARRSAIARLAARARWGKSPLTDPPLSSVRLEQPRWENPVYLSEVLTEGSLADWRGLYQVLAEYPFGPVALALEKVLQQEPIYGVTPLWQGILRGVQGEVR